MASEPGGGRDTSVSPSTQRLEIISESRESGSRSDNATLPDTKITLFAVKLAILEKVASGLGYLAFAWATVVLLGGFASFLETADFWVVTTILSIEGARIFSRSQEVKWHHEIMLKAMATLIGEAKRLSDVLFKCSSSNKGNENSGADDDDSQNKAWMSKVSRLLLLLQLLSAFAYIGLSIYRLWLDESGDSGSDTKNLKAALKIFYGLSLTESFLILLEKAYWLWNIYVRKLLKEVNDEYGFGESELDTVERFLYATYSRCVDGSVFDGLKMEFVTHSIELLQSGSVKGQLAGAQVLSALASNKKFAEKTLRAIGTKRDVVERLIDMLNFKNEHEQEIRKAAAQIISKLVENNVDRSNWDKINVDRSNWDKINRDCIRVTAIDGFMESIACLLYSKHSSTGDFVSLGLTILQKLANERSNHDKIASSRGLLPRIVALIEPLERQTLIDLEQLERQKLALQIVENLASTTGSRGKALRKQIREIVFSISNLRKVLQNKEDSMHCLQILAIDTLTSLASEPKGRKNIGSTGGVLHDLLSLFFMKRVNNGSETEELVKKAGEALSFLSLESKLNCEIMMSFKLDDHRNLIASLIPVLNYTVQGIHVARILRNLLAYAKAYDVNSSEISSLAAQVLKIVTENYSCLPQEAAITQREEQLGEPQEAAITEMREEADITQREEHACEHLEAAIGLAAEFFVFMTKTNPDEKLSGIPKKCLISTLEKVLQSHRDPSKEVPNIRRFSIELLIAVMKRDKVALEIRSELEGVMERDRVILEMRLKLAEALEGVMNTTSDWEYYNAFAGSMGLSRHRRSIRSLANSAMQLLPGILKPIADSGNIPESND